MANISETEGDIQNRNDVVDSDFSRVGRKSSVNFDPLTTKLDM